MTIEMNLPRTFSAFSGVDAIAVLNGVVIGEFQGYEFTETFEDIQDEDGNPTGVNRFTGYMTIAVFDREPLFRETLQPEDNEFIIFLGNESGQKASIRFENIRFTERTGGLEVDHVVMQEKYFFECDDHYISPEEWAYDPNRLYPYYFVN
jgi:hypothetical protein